ncbi:MAG: ABC transporter substrate-binding protein [Alphaproteobacteria bacterium]|nr:ABC transporter substrate-binding protein [Alphaproteobacteria bacterium]MCW5744129.1 ABC transporter substrate-binding protein [Alphaproteobacteria bacterium]
MIGVGRRGVILAAAALPAAAGAQPARRRHRLAYLSGGSLAARQKWIDALLEGLAALGYERGRNLELLLKGAEGRFERLPALAAEVVAWNPDVMVASTTPGVLAAKAATTRIPIVMVAQGDPLGVGIVKSLARPEANVTGYSNATVELVGKRLQLLKELLPRARRVAVIVNPDDSNVERQMANARSTARALGIELAPVAQVRALADLDAALAQAATADGALRFVDPLTSMLRPAIQQAAARHRVPVSYPFAEDVALGGLIGYGANQAHIYRRAAQAVHRLLQGATPAQLPVEMPTVFELAINLRTAKALGITVPQTLLAGATDVFE